MNMDLNKLVFLPIQSLIVDEARELIEELRVDIAADKTPASNNPFNPIGKWWTMNDE